MQPTISTPRTAHRIKDFLEVRPHPTVVRLSDAEAADADWITSAYHLTADVRNHLHALEEALSRPAGTGVFLIGQYGSGKSHFLAYLTRVLRAGKLVPDPPEARAVSLLNYRASATLEEIVLGAVGLAADGSDRRLAWNEVSSSGRFSGGLVLILDELSEFLRSKPDRSSFHEDIRFLQFLGEWAQDRRLWVIAAVQEGIEHTGDLEYSMYRKIKDRFPLRFILSPAHVKDLLSGSILQKKEGFEAAMDALVKEVRECIPRSALNPDDLRAVYPIHPSTLQMLEEVRDRFSLARGIVDFAVTQLRGDRARGIEPYLERPWGSLLTPDAIVDHFRDLFEIQPEFVPLAQQVFPYYGKRIDELFDTPPLRDLAWKLLKLLVLAHLSPSRKGLRPDEAVGFLLYRVARIDPEKNIRIVERVLSMLAEEGRHVTFRGGKYAIELEDVGLEGLEAFIEREKAELRERGDMVFEICAGLLGDADFTPFIFPRDRWQRRVLRWHFHERSCSVHLGNDDVPPPPEESFPIIVRLPWGNPRHVAGAYTILPAPLEPGEEHWELAACARARQRSWPEAAARRIASRMEERLALFRGQIRGAYLDGTVVGRGGESQRAPRPEGGLTFPGWFDSCFEGILRRAYPAFERFAPSHGPLAKEAYKSYLRFAANHDLGDPDAADNVVDIVREAYLVPMGLLRRKGREYQLAPNPQANELVRLIQPLIDRQPTPKVVYDRLAEPVYGLVPDQVSLLLIHLLLLGEIDIVKEGKSYRDAFETLPHPILYDRIVPGSALRADRIREVEKLCQGLGVRLPKQWNVLSQKQAAHRLRDAGRARTERLEKLLVKLDDAGEAKELADRIRKIVLAWRVFEEGAGEIEALEWFLERIGPADRFLAALKELEGLPERLDRLIAEVERLRYLLGQPSVAGWPDEKVRILIESLDSPPGLEKPEAVESWTAAARKAYEAYRKSYADRHAAWWATIAKHVAWSWQPPAVAASRHLGLEEPLRQLRNSRDRAERSRCRGLGVLEFHPLCTCAFDGEKSAIAEELGRFESIRAEIERAAREFFADEEVRSRVRDWVRDGVESESGAAAYLNGERPYPEISNLDTFDRHLAGLDVVKELSLPALHDFLGERTWEKSALVQAFDGFVQAAGADRIRFAKETSRERTGVLAWCAETALRFAVPLPQGLGSRDLEAVAQALRPEWVSEAAVRDLSSLRLGDDAVDRIALWLATGEVRGPAGGSASPPAAAALEVFSPRDPQSPRALAALVEVLYGEHLRMMRVARDRWLERLDRLARTPLEKKTPDLTDLLRARADCQWVVLDCLGAPLLGTLLRELPEMFEDWSEPDVEFGLAPSRTTTDDFYRGILAAGIDHSFEKITTVDTLLHERFLPLEDISRLAAAELRAAARGVRKRLDPERPLLVFADHGFRIAKDGRSYRHGGDSTLERLVPVILLEPR